MPLLQVTIELSGEPVKVGTIEGDTPQSAVFRYCREYLDRPETSPISVMLPLREESFSAVQTRCFFEGLLPEGFTRRSVAQWMRVDAEDYLSILAGLGKECLGAVRVSVEGQPEIPSYYEKLTMEQVQALAREGTTKSAELVTKSHLSLTGASGKVGLYYHEKENAWYLPKGNAPSTHIVKQSHVRLDGIVANEQLCLSAASLLGLNVPKSFIIRCGDDRDENVLLATRRYDRIIPEAGEKLNGLPVPQRLHQEDFAQAMGIASADKYERSGEEGYLKKMFALLRSTSSNPVQDTLALWDLLCFDFLVGNTDCHVKNCSLLYGENLKRIRLAPAYDILSTSVYPSSTRDMAFSIGGVLSLDDINREAFRKAAAEAKLGVSMAMNHLDSICERFEPALQEATEELSEKGFRKAKAICRQILETGGCRQLL